MAYRRHCWAGWQEPWEEFSSTSPSPEAVWANPPQGAHFWVHSSFCAPSASPRVGKLFHSVPPTSFKVGTRSLRENKHQGLLNTQRWCPASGVSDHVCSVPMLHWYLSIKDQTLGWRDAWHPAESSHSSPSTRRPLLGTALHVPGGLGKRTELWVTQRCE